MINDGDVHEAHGYRTTHHYQPFDHIDHLGGLKQTIAKGELRSEKHPLLRLKKPTV